VNLLSVVGLMMVGAMQVASGGCSSSSELYGGGGCESFCTKWIGAHCRKGVSKEDCMTDCQGEQFACPDAKNALMRCATLEATIACETGSGEPRIVGCAPKQVELETCKSCYSVCKQIEDVACTLAPSRQECLAACTGTKCANLYERFVDCRPGQPTCTDDGHIDYQFSTCSSLWFQLQSCMAPGGAFFVPRPVEDAGLDAIDEVSTDTGGFGGPFP
jgi:hypothetical protein